MGNINKVILLGNLTRDIELRHTQSNQAVANFSIAVNRQWKDQSGQTHEEATFVDCESWGRQAEVMPISRKRPRSHAGRPTSNGPLARQQSGANRSKLVVVVESFQFIGGRAEAGGNAAMRPPKSLLVWTRLLFPVQCPWGWRYSVLTIQKEEWLRCPAQLSLSLKLPTILFLPSGKPLGSRSSRLLTLIF